MLHEFAVEPECLNASWDRFLRIIGEFGVQKGRLISRFPKKWQRMVDETCSGFSFIDRQKMEIELTRIGRQALVKSGRDYSPSNSWKRNAVEQHGSNPFHAIIANKEEEDPDIVLNAADITPDTLLWNVHIGDSIDRTVEALGNAVSKLLRISKKIKFIDRNFDPCIDRFQRTLCSFITIAVNGREDQPTFEYHFSLHPDKLLIGGNPRDFGQYCAEHLENILPDGIQLKLFRWEEKSGGESLHARLVLTEKGVINIEHGLDSGKPGQKTDIQIQSENLWKKHWSEYQETSSTFNLVDTVTVEGKG